MDYVLEGSAQREADRVRITAELIKVADQTQLWADTYERELSGILTVQSEVAQSVAEALALKLLPGRAGPPGDRPRPSTPRPTRPISRGPPSGRR